MEKVVLKTNLSCKHCVLRVESVLKDESGILDYSIDLEHPDKLITIFSEGMDINDAISKFNAAGYSAEKI